ncbi:MAG TPA: ATP-dependent DNA helicase RecQ [Ignavibacteriaceae bacterium]|jgi:ATP-dependent DNA helicase RecQ|nr:MAG: ATP-dependent DNA helicase RecQ [Ignavibacteria bacterium ADurb.Bin266]OQY72756.1 MAG: ATP-dependent DNA helicase [Ignavibacteriales bacterium UTCHB2]HQF41910.1 ATP-dependent DNA helicase RecQ [Ignavibacteriaceae bacterium]HQI40677.1 ATP-dependent DNA helicase RecQ [Ignavibacteriaceae bacterium]HQJ45591.1 ATP-dependent DNA helicase RecQ [Ignavibacteriaceae bacterium]
MKKDIYKILKSYFGHNSFYDAQEKIIKEIAENRKHLLVLMPTGSGKSLCYQIPALYFDNGTIVISPLIALMQDQVDALRKKNIPAAFINSTLSKQEREKRLADFVKGNIKLLYVTPERFRKKDFVDEIKKIKIDLLAVDEAHCISEWGHDFRPDYSRIGEFRELLGKPLTIALTATATREVQEDIITKLNIKKDEIKIFHQGIERPNLRLEAVDIFDDREKLKEILSTLEKYNGSGIIYFSLIKTLERFSEILSDKGFNHGIYHGKLEDKERKRMQRDFLSDKQKLILATNAFGMGIDKPDIRFVIHAEVPSSIESYYQEIGRAGRDGKDSLCLLLYNQEDLYTRMEFIKWSNPDADFYFALYNLLKRDLGLINSSGIEYLREQMNFKNKNDFRIETALAMLDRYGVTEGEIEKKNLKIIDELPEVLQDEEHLKEKLLNDNKKLLSVVNYFRNENCRRVFISDYFGFPGEKPCGNCDNCEFNRNEH